MLSAQQRQHLEQVLEHFEKNEWLEINQGHVQVKDHPTIPERFIEQLLAGGWLIEVDHQKKEYGFVARWRLAPGPAWWNEKQQEHAAKLAEASDRLNKSIRVLTAWGVLIALAALGWNILSRFF